MAARNGGLFRIESKDRWFPRRHWLLKDAGNQKFPTLFPYSSLDYLLFLLRALRVLVVDLALSCHAPGHEPAVLRGCSPAKSVTPIVGPAGASFC